MATVIRPELSTKNRYYIDKTAIEADPYLYGYIIKGVTESRSFTYLKTKLGISCGKDIYYDRYRKFFWLLNGNRESIAVE